jgi:dTDP-4-amino-4,6-dideoxygalactose transaminase
LIEDAAQALGSRVSGRAAGTWGLAGCFSFFPTKPLGALGDGGLVITNDDDVAARCRRLREHGSVRRGEHLEIGGNYRLDALQAAALSVKLRLMTSWMEARRSHAAEYDRAFATVRGLQLPDRTPFEGWNGSIYTVRVLDGRREELREFFANCGVQTAVYYETPLHLQPALASFAPRVDLREAELASREVLSLPLYAEMTSAQRDRVIEAAGRFYC